MRIRRGCLSFRRPAIAFVMPRLARLRSCEITNTIVLRDFGGRPPEGSALSHFSLRHRSSFALCWRYCYHSAQNFFIGDKQPCLRAICRRNNLWIATLRSLKGPLLHVLLLVSRPYGIHHPFCFHGANRYSLTAIRGCPHI